MRITGGRLRGRVVAAPEGVSTRPTTDLARESLFAMLAHRIDLRDISVLDLCSGSGILAFESLSRGASSATLVDHDASVCRLARSNAQSLDCTNEVKVIRTDVMRALDHLVPTSYALVFADPPYAARQCNAILSGLDRCGLVAAGGLVVLEHDDSEVVLPLHGWEHLDARRFGATVIDIVRHLPTSS
ncbi:MAG: 16S rRNA (guanine(966)-N(2))-methyltransferase RsmD [Candidatus Kapabacteria bacterium]|nr:16S rRNA (guanine(966)-N(2))-methyltransferase RsmD [Candidatus Kapabacteria bacterium]